MNESRRALIKARTSLLLDHPFFGSLCLRMEPREDASCATAWTDGRTLGYNPAYVRGLTDAQVQGLLAHTVMHPACQHHTRRGDRDHDLWNAACDHAVNWILLDAGIDLPPRYLDNPAYHGLTADEIYADMRSHKSEEERPSLSDGAGENEGDADWDGLPGEGQAGDDGEEGGDSGSGDAGEGEAADDDNGGDDGDGGGEEQFGDPGGSGEVRDAVQDDRGGGFDESQSDEQWELALAQAAQQARDMGELPGGLERLIREALNPKLDWRELLDRFISERVRDDYSWLPPNPRYLHMDVLLPSLSHQKLPEIVLAVDASGSVTEPEMDQFAAEMSGILENYDTTVHVVYCDSRVNGVDSFGRQDLPIDISPQGGGGTDYRPVFSWISEAGMDPACLVYLTDMECVHFPEEPDYPVLWAQIGVAARRPPFGETLAIQ